MKTGLIAVAAIALSVSPAISAKRHHLHLQGAHAATLNLTRVNLHPVNDLQRPVQSRDFTADRLPIERSFRLAPGGWTGSVGYHTSAGVGAAPQADFNPNLENEYGKGDKTVGAAVGIKF